jgi:glutamyl-tRNA reductase
VRELSVVNRSEERATALATEYKADALPWSMLTDALATHDIVVTSTAAPHAVIIESDVRTAMRRRKSPLMFIDLAVPRDVEAGVGRLSDVYLYNIDHLEAVVAANRNLRAEEVDAANALVDALVSGYVTDQRRDQGALLAQVAGYFEDVIAAEEARLKGKLNLTDSKELRYGLERVGNKLQHQVLRILRDHPNDPAIEGLVREMLGLK